MKTALRWAGVGALVLVGGLAVVASGVYGVSEYRIHKTFEAPVAAMVASDDPDVIARGRHLAVTRGCVDCHAPDFRGRTIIDDPLAGRISGTNLTRGRGGVIDRYTDEQLVTAIRHGVTPDGKALLFMPSHEFYPFSDEDVHALISYIRSLAPVDHEVPKHRVGPLARALFLAGQMPLVPAELIDHGSERPAAPEEAETVEYGAYMATGCIGCHGPGYSGGRIPGTPPSFPVVRNITPDVATGLGGWTEEDFFRAMREGKRPDGSDIDPFMPWENTREMTDVELRALWLFLQTLPPKPEGNR
jgi:mono/diheme cytochrome c family protein